MEKYYTPEIEELLPDTKIFLVSDGDETNREVSKHLIRVEESGVYLLIDLEEMYKKSINNYKIKYLDKEDIESLGFEYNYSTNNGWKIYKTSDLKYELIQYNYEDRDIWICKNPPLHEVIDATSKITYKNTIFRGEIKNKSELKRLLKQLCITK